ncbi:hypothetical protein [Halorussus caseinilyticus]|uniref:hypothetical protein n=1 Tax=Halorussus caseinilyticus TaxID=3034025 RepID=UPI0023E79732|nr:hypothetical protein [Halorussus sp. DT72]
MDEKLTRRLLARRRLYLWSVASGLVAALFVVSTGFDPGTLTPTTREAVRTTASAYYSGLAWPHAATLVMLVYHGPYLVGLFGSIVGFTFASVLLHGWQFGSITTATELEHDASTETVASILALVAVHGVVLTAAAYLPAVLYVAVEKELVNPFGAWVALGPVLVVGFTLAGGLAIALAGVLDGAASRGGVALFAFAPPLAGLQFAHAAPTRHPQIGLLGTSALLVAFSVVGWRALRRRTE